MSWVWLSSWLEGWLKKVAEFFGIKEAEAPRPTLLPTPPVGEPVTPLGVYTQADLDYCKARFGAKQGEPNYDAFCDPNKDGVIDIVDVTYMSRHLEQRTQPPAKTQETPVRTKGKDELQPPEASAIEVKKPESLPIPEIGEEGKRRRIRL